MDFITAPLTCGVFCYFTYMVFELFARRRERTMLIEKMGQNLPPFDPSVLKNQMSSLLPSFPKMSFTGLRIGCLLLGLGLGLLSGLFINLNIKQDMAAVEYYELARFYSVAYGASVLLFGGLGLLVAYLIERKERRKE